MDLEWRRKGRKKKKRKAVLRSRRAEENLAKENCHTGGNCMRR